MPDINNINTCQYCQCHSPDQSSDPGVSQWSPGSQHREAEQCHQVWTVCHSLCHVQTCLCCQTLLHHQFVDYSDQWSSVIISDLRTWYWPELEHGCWPAYWAVTLLSPHTDRVALASEMCGWASIVEWLNWPWDTLQVLQTSIRRTQTTGNL